MMTYDKLDGKEQAASKQEALQNGSGELSDAEAMSFVMALDYKRVLGSGRVSDSTLKIYLGGIMNTLTALGYSSDWVYDFMQGLLLGRFFALR